MLRNRALNENSVNILAEIKDFNKLKKLFFRSFLRKGVSIGIEANFFTSFLLISNVYL